MADSFVQVAPDGSGKMIDNDQITVGLNTVFRQRTVNASPSNAAGLAEVVNAAPTTQYGLVVWTSQLPALVSGRMPVDGSGVTQPVSIAGTVTTTATVSGTVAVSNFPGTQPVSGTVTANQGGSWSVTVGAGTADVGKVRFSTPTTSALTQASVSVNGSGDNTLVAGVGGQTVRVYRLVLVFAAGVNATLKDGASTALTGAMTMTTGGSIVLDFAGEPWYVTSTANAFILNLSAGVQASGTIWYTQS